MERCGHGAQISAFFCSATPIIRVRHRARGQTYLSPQPPDMTGRALPNGTRTDSAAPVQVGSATNWTKIWAGALQSVGQQSDGSLWVWGDNPAFAMGTNSLLTPTRLSADTNWVDVAMGTYTTFGLK